MSVKSTMSFMRNCTFLSASSAAHITVQSTQIVKLLEDFRGAEKRRCVCVCV